MTYSAAYNALSLWKKNIDTWVGETANRHIEKHKKNQTTCTYIVLHTASTKPNEKQGAAKSNTILYEDSMNSSYRILLACLRAW